MSSMRRTIQKHELISEEHLRIIEGKREASVARRNRLGKGNGICYIFANTGKCDVENCPFSHDVQPRSKGGKKGKEDPGKGPGGEP